MAGRITSRVWVIGEPCIVTAAAGSNMHAHTHRSSSSFASFILTTRAPWRVAMRSLCPGLRRTVPNTCWQTARGWMAGLLRNSAACVSHRGSAAHLRPCPPPPPPLPSRLNPSPRSADLWRCWPASPPTCCSPENRGYQSGLWQRLCRVWAHKGEGLTLQPTGLRSAMRSLQLLLSHLCLVLRIPCRACHVS